MVRSRSRRSRTLATSDQSWPLRAGSAKLQEKSAAQTAQPPVEPNSMELGVTFSLDVCSVSLPPCGGRQVSTCVPLRRIETQETVFGNIGDLHKRRRSARQSHFLENENSIRRVRIAAAGQTARRITDPAAHDCGAASDLNQGTFGSLAPTDIVKDRLALFISHSGPSLVSSKRPFFSSRTGFSAPTSM